MKSNQDRSEETLYVEGVEIGAASQLPGATDSGGALLPVVKDATRMVELFNPADDGGPAMPVALLVPIPADRHPAAVYLARLAPGSRRTMATSLEIMAGLLTSYRCNMQTLDWSALRYQHTSAVRALLADLYAPATANKMMCALRGVLREAWRLGQMSAEDYRRAADLGSVRGETVPAGRELPAGQLDALMQACQRDQGPAGPRDAAIIGLMYSAGLRRAEVVALDLADYQVEQSRLVVRGKGRKERTAYVIEGAAFAIQDWLHARGLSPGPLFWPVNKGEKVVKRRMTTQAVYNVLHKRVGEAGIASSSPHDLRRTFVSNLLDKGADISTVSRMAGHASVQTTARYDRRPEEAKRKASELLHLSYRRREK